MLRLVSHSVNRRAAVAAEEQEEEEGYVSLAEEEEEEDRFTYYSQHIPIRFSNRMFHSFL